MCRSGSQHAHGLVGFSNTAMDWRDSAAPVWNPHTARIYTVDWRGIQIFTTAILEPIQKIESHLKIVDQVDFVQ